MPPGRPLCVSDREARADSQGGELIDRVAAGAPVGKLLVAEALRHARVPSSPQSTRIVQRKRRPTSNVDSMMELRPRRGGTGSKYVTLRGGLRRAIPFLLVRSECDERDPLFYADKRSGLPAYCRAKTGK